MNRIRYIAFGLALIVAAASFAQQADSGTGPAARGVPSADDQLRVLTKALDLTRDQQAKFRPILDHLHDATLKLVMDKTLTQDQRMSQVRPLRYDADRKMRAVLTEEQQKKLDQFEQEPHPEMHGSLDGHTPPHSDRF